MDQTYSEIKNALSSSTELRAFFLIDLTGASLGIRKSQDAPLGLP